MSRIDLFDNGQDAIVKMSNGNPGALKALMELLSDESEINPKARGLLGNNWDYLLQLDTYGIYGTDIYVLWNDICKNDIKKFKFAISASQHGIIKPEILKIACSKQDRSGAEMLKIDDLFYPYNKMYKNEQNDEH